MRILKIAPLLIVLFSSIAIYAADREPLEIRFAERTITVEDMTRGGSVVFFAIARQLVHERPRMYGQVRHVDVLSDTDGDGVVQREFSGGVPSGIWAFVDTTSGRYTVVPTPGSRPERVDFSAELLKNDNAGQLRKLQWPFAEMEVLLVRPGSGAWRLNASKYSGLDENKNKHDSLRIDVASMTPVATSPAAPHNFKPGDVVVVMNPRWMQYGVIEVGK